MYIVDGLYATSGQKGPPPCDCAERLNVPYLSEANVVHWWRLAEGKELESISRMLDNPRLDRIEIQRIDSDDYLVEVSFD